MTLRDAPEDLLTVAEAAAETGLSPRTIREAVRTGILPSVIGIVTHASGKRTASPLIKRLSLAAIEGKRPRSTQGKPSRWKAKQGAKT